MTRPMTRPGGSRSAGAGGGLSARRRPTGRVGEAAYPAQRPGSTPGSIPAQARRYRPGTGGMTRPSPSPGGGNRPGSGGVSSRAGGNRPVGRLSSRCGWESSRRGRLSSGRAAIVPVPAGIDPVRAAISPGAWRQSSRCRRGSTRWGWLSTWWGWLSTRRCRAAIVLVGPTTATTSGSSTGRSGINRPGGGWGGGWFGNNNGSFGNRWGGLRGWPGLGWGRFNSPFLGNWYRGSWGWNRFGGWFGAGRHGILGPGDRPIRFFPTWGFAWSRRLGTRPVGQWLALLGLRQPVFRRSRDRHDRSSRIGLRSMFPITAVPST